MTKQNTKDAIAIKGQKAGLIIYPINDNIGIAIMNKEEKKVDNLELSKEQWLEISEMVLKSCFNTK